MGLTMMVKDCICNEGKLVNEDRSLILGTTGLVNHVVKKDQTTEIVMWLKRDQTTESSRQLLNNEYCKLTLMKTVPGSVEIFTQLCLNTLNWPLST